MSDRYKMIEQQRHELKSYAANHVGLTILFEVCDAFDNSFMVICTKESASRLLEGLNQNPMSEIGRIGGQVSSKAKRLASKLNGMKGGRPRKILHEGVCVNKDNNDTDHTCSNHRIYPE